MMIFAPSFSRSDDSNVRLEGVTVPFDELKEMEGKFFWRGQEVKEVARSKSSRESAG